MFCTTLRSQHRRRWSTSSTAPRRATAQPGGEKQTPQLIDCNDSGEQIPPQHSPGGVPPAPGVLHCTVGASQRCLWLLQLSNLHFWGAQWLWKPNCEMLTVGMKSSLLWKLGPLTKLKVGTPEIQAPWWWVALEIQDNIFCQRSRRGFRTAFSNCQYLGSIYIFSFHIIHKENQNTKVQT